MNQESKKELLNITQLTEYLYCPRKFYIKKFRKIKEPPTKPMILGMLKHKVFDILSKNDQFIVSGISERLSKQQISQLYKRHIFKIIDEIFNLNSNLIFKFKISLPEFSSSVLSLMEREVQLKSEAVFQTLEKGFLRNKLWKNLKPKYMTEIQLVSEKLGLKGRVDRIKLEENSVLPYELKTRDDIFPSDKIQLAAYALLIEDQFELKVDKGIIESAKNKQEVIIDQELKNQVLELVDEIRNLNEAPPLLENFNKCKPCRLKEECLED